MAKNTWGDDFYPHSEERRLVAGILANGPDRNDLLWALFELQRPMAESVIRNLTYDGSVLQDQCMAMIDVWVGKAWLSWKPGNGFNYWARRYVVEYARNMVKKEPPRSDAFARSQARSFGTDRSDSVLEVLDRAGVGRRDGVMLFNGDGQPLPEELPVFLNDDTNRAVALLVRGHTEVEVRAILGFSKAVWKQKRALIETKLRG